MSRLLRDLVLDVMREAGLEGVVESSDVAIPSRSAKPLLAKGRFCRGLKPCRVHFAHECPGKESLIEQLVVCDTCRLLSEATVADSHVQPSSPAVGGAFGEDAGFFSTRCQATSLRGNFDMRLMFAADGLSHGGLPVHRHAAGSRNVEQPDGPRRRCADNACRLDAARIVFTLECAADDLVSVDASGVVALNV
jgi:hypothetical protein